MMRSVGSSAPMSCATVGNRSIVDGELIALRAGRNLAGPAHDARHAVAAFPHRALAFAQRAGGAGVVAVVEPRAVVGGEDDERVVIEAVALERVEDLADRPVDFHHDIAEQAGAAFAAELVGDVQRHVDHRVRHVQKERPRPCCGR